MHHLLLLGAIGAEVVGVLTLLWLLFRSPRRLREERALRVLASWPSEQGGPPPAVTWCRPLSAMVPAPRQASSSAISASMSTESSSQPLGTAV